MNNLDTNLLAENREMLERFEADGSDMSAVRQIDFEHLFEDRGRAVEFLRLVESHGLKTTLYDRDDGKWDAQATCEMKPSAEGITSVEQKLGALASQLGGKPDGWGFFRTDS